MRELPRFIKIDEDRINIDEIVSYGFGSDEDDETFLYVETKTGEDVYQYYEEDVEFDLQEKLDELDALLLVKIFGNVDFQQRQD